MNLKQVLRKAGYDLIDSPIRNHKPLQLWLKKPFNSVELYYEHVTHALSSNEVLNVIQDSALSVDYEQEQEYNFNVGITVLEELLTSLGLANLGLSTNFDGGKKVTLSYSSSETLSVANGEISNFLSTADFKHPNKDFMRNANRDNILIISGVLTAKDIKATIETHSDIDAELTSKMKEVAEGKVDFSLVSSNKLEMKSEGNSPFPVAVKANRIDWDKGEFNKMSLVTDNRFFF